jgi:hypothetical protein
MMSKGLDLETAKDDKKPEKEVVKRPGFGRFDLDTGLSREKKIQVRYAKELQIQKQAKENG